MRTRRDSLLHEGGCDCRRCRFESRATTVIVLAVGAALSALGYWFHVEWLKAAVGR